MATLQVKVWLRASKPASAERLVSRLTRRLDRSVAHHSIVFDRSQVDPKETGGFPATARVALSGLPVSDGVLRVLTILAALSHAIGLSGPHRYKDGGWDMFGHATESNLAVQAVTFLTFMATSGESDNHANLRLTGDGG